ncbi:protein kinase domain-containing protein [Actinocorallia libanotica]|uniref:Protein kinase domain-containing protein n=1 Tax=Actinocorallia libanotica TaxID=46162 RepID=A0ABP4C6P2_9ACTN
MRPFEPGDPGLVGGLWLSGRLGEGPLGVVFLGQQADGTKVAVKLLHAHLTEDPAVWEAYQRAMEAVCALEVPHTARALSTGLVGARPYLMSEYVEGIPLPDIPEPFSAAELERLAVRTAAALAGLHAAGIPHGALRPSNVIMSAQGAVLTDFGLAPDREAALAADPADWARLVQAAAGEQELPPRLRTLTEACLSAVPPSAAELRRQLTAPTSDPGVTVAELAAPPAAFGRPAAEPAAPLAAPPASEPVMPPAAPPAAGPAPGAPETSWEIPPPGSWEPLPAADASPASSPASSNGALETPRLPAEAAPAAPGTSWEVPPVSSGGTWEIPPAASGAAWEVPPAEPQGPRPQGTQEPQEPQAEGAAAGREEPPAPQIELMVTAFDAPVGVPMGGDPAHSAAPAADQTMLDAVANPAAQEWGMQTRVEALPMPGAPAEPVHGQAPPPAGPPVGPPAPAFEASPPWAGEAAGGGGAKRPLLVAAASVTVALLLVGIFAMTRSGGEGDPQPLAVKTGVPHTSEPSATPPPAEPSSTPTPSAPVKAQQNAGSPTPKPSKTSPPPPSPTKKPRKPPQNLLANGSFEQGFGRWEPRAASFLGAKAAHSGKRAVLLSAGQGYDAAVEYVVSGLKPNTTYQVVGWVRSDVGATFIGAKDFGPNSSYVSSASKKWTRLSVNFKTGDGTTARLYCWREVPGNGGCDDMALYRR